MFRITTVWHPTSQRSGNKARGWENCCQTGLTGLLQSWTYRSVAVSTASTQLQFSAEGKGFIQPHPYLGSYWQEEESVFFKIVDPSVLPSPQRSCRINTPLDSVCYLKAEEEDMGCRRMVGMSRRSWKWRMGDGYDPNALYTCRSFLKNNYNALIGRTVTVEFCTWESEGRWLVSAWNISTETSERRRNSGPADLTEFSMKQNNHLMRI